MAGKKRKAGSRQPSTKTKDSALQSKFDLNETFDDSEDEFIAGRDHILLEEGPETKRRRKMQEEEAYFQPSDEEVLGYDEDEDEDEDELDKEDYDDEDEDEEEDEEDNDDGYAYGKLAKRPRGETSSIVNQDDGEDEEGLGAWGSSKKDFYNADAIETEADALEEEEEAKRLQQKHLKAMKEADFGFDEIDWLESGQGADGNAQDRDGVITEVLPQLEITDDMSSEEQLKILKSRYPEFEPLSKDFVELQPKYPDLLAAAEKSQEAMDDISAPSPIPVIKFRALSAYLGSISMYFALLTSPAEDDDGKVMALPPAELRDHPVMESLVKCRKLWQAVKDLEIVNEPEPKEQESNDIDIDLMESTTDVAVPKSAKERKAKLKTSNEKKITKSQRAAEKAKEEAKAIRLERIKKAEAKLADLDDLVKARNRKIKSQTKISEPQEEEDDSDFGDEGALTARELEEKAKKRRSLRFYTSQIAQKNNKRGAAGRNAGGDEDLPYRERLKDRQARLNAEAERRGRAQANEAEQLGGESDEDDRRLAREIRGDAEGTDDDEYYDMVAARNKQKKADKKARAELAEAQGGRVEQIDEIGPDGKRRITYQIEKNKGLAPKRNKDVRNPRVKKRKKFQQKQKKLGSIRQVYKGGEGRGGYGGELTGIKKNLVKSVKL